MCITGTPGVGKSTVMKELLSRGYDVQEFDGLIGECVLEMKDDERIIDDGCLRKIRTAGVFFGHLSHYARCDKVVVIRAHLKDIEIRLKKRGYSKSKIMDNIESEAIDLIGFESEKMHPGNTLEILNSSVKKTADFIENVIKGKNSTSVKIDLVEEILDWY
jgi:adenylate kinase